MATPVIVSRIQNRRGLQIDFDGYPWSGGAGPDSAYPEGYTGVEGYNSIAFPDFTAVNYPNVLLPGELCVCTDTRHIYMGDVNGTYIVVTTGISGGVVLDQLTPIVWPIVGGNPYAPVTRNSGAITLEYDSTPFFDIMYSVTDAPTTNWNAVGPTYAENGTLKVTAVQYFTPNLPNPVPLLPDITPATLYQSSEVIDLNTPTLVNLSFIAQYDITHTKIQILFKHDYVGTLYLSTNTIKWIPI